MQLHQRTYPTSGHGAELQRLTHGFQAVGRQLLKERQLSNHANGYIQLGLGTIIRSEKVDQHRSESPGVKYTKINRHTSPGVLSDSSAFPKHTTLSYFFRNTAVISSMENTTFIAGLTVALYTSMGKTSSSDDARLQTILAVTGLFAPNDSPSPSVAI